MRRLVVEYKGQREESEEWPEEFRGLIKLANCWFPHVKIDRVVEIREIERDIRDTDDLREAYAAAEETGLVHLRLVGEEYCCQNLGACLPPPGFCRSRPTPPPTATLTLPQCYKCQGTGRVSLRDCKVCTGAGVVDVAAVPKLAAIVTFVRREVARLSLGAFSDTMQSQGEVHAGIRCILCGCLPITGVRYCCSACEDYNLCSRCEGSEPHPHPFIKIRQANSADPRPGKPLKNRQCDPEIRLCCRFVKDVKGKEGEVHPATSKFQKSWRVRNTGHTAWPRGCCMIFVNGDFDGPPAPMPAIAPNEECDISVTCTAPAREGEYYSLWRACDATGMRFGHRLGIKIRVVARTAPSEEIKELERCLESQPEETVAALRAAEGDLPSALALLSASRPQS